MGLRRSKAFRGLGREQRRAVREALRRGEAVDDPALVRPLLEAVEGVLATPFPATAFRVVIGLAAALNLFSAAVSVPDHWLAALSRGSMAVFLLVMLFAVPPMVRRGRERAARAAELTVARFPVAG